MSREKERGVSLYFCSKRVRSLFSVKAICMSFQRDVETGRKKECCSSAPASAVFSVGVISPGLSAPYIGRTFASAAPSRNVGKRMDETLSS